MEDIVAGRGLRVSTKKTYTNRALEVDGIYCGQCMKPILSFVCDDI